MFESVLAVPLHFTIEFLGFLVAAGGALLALSRPTLVPGAASNRVYVALGFLTLAAAQVLHGGAFIPFEGDTLLLGIRAFAYALMLVGVSGGLRPQAAAIAGFELREPLQMIPAGAAFFLAAAALSGSRHGGPSSARRLAAGAFFLALSEVATAASPEFEVGAFDRYAYAAHGAKALGFLFVGGWLWSAVRSSIRTRFVASFGALLVAVILVLSTALTGVISTNVEREELDRIAAQVVSAARFIHDQRGVVGQEAETISQLREVAEGVASGDNLNGLARSIRQLQIGAERPRDFVIIDPTNGPPGIAGQGPFVTPDRRKPLTRLDVLDILGTPVAREVINGEVPLSANVVRTGDYVAVIAASRIPRPEGGGRQGVLIIGRFVDALTVEGRAAAVNAGVSLIIGNEVFASEGIPRRAAAQLEMSDDIRSELLRSGVATRQATLEQVSYFSGYAFIRNVRTATLVISSRATVVQSSRAALTRLLFLAAMLVGAIALVLAWFSGRRITRPIQQLTVTAGAVREGDLAAVAEVSGDDEVGQLGETFNEMTASLLKMTNDLREAAREEHNLRARIETILESMADGLVAVDSQRKVLAFNKEAEHLTGIDAASAVGQPVEEILVALDPQGQPVSLPIYSLTEGSVGGVSIKREGSDPVPVAITSAVLRGEDEGVEGAVTVLRDMTREREIERMKTEFLSNISHELRTPLTPIKGYAEILARKEVPPEKVKQFTRGILESTSRLERIVELLVDFSAMEAGRLSPRTTPVDLSGILVRLARDWNARVTSHEIVIDLEEPVLEAAGDERLLKRSLDEVIDNAVKFSPEGGEIKLAARRAQSMNGSTGRRFIEVTITDPGIGIQPDDLGRIFSDFHQLDGSETRTYGGLGLGLAFVHRIIEAHTGTIEVESVPDEGSTFTIRLPAAQVSEEPAADGDEAAEQGEEGPLGAPASAG